MTFRCLLGDLRKNFVFLSKGIFVVATLPFLSLCLIGMVVFILFFPVLHINVMPRDMVDMVGYETITV
jgi:hypothetical protein